MSRRKLPFMLERIRRCRTCGVEVDRPALEFMENPCCTRCLSGSVNRDQAPVEWCRNGHYMEVTPVEQTRR